MTEYLRDPAIVVALISVVLAIISFLGMIVTAFVSTRNKQIEASDEIASGSTKMLVQYRLEVEAFRTEVADLKRVIVDWENKYYSLDEKWEMKYKKLYDDHIRVIELNEELTDRVRYLEKRLDTGEYKKEKENK